MSISQKTTLEQIQKENVGLCISEISIIHRTGRPRIIFEQGNIYDISFDNLILSLNNNTKLFNETLLIKYCSFSKKQVNKLIESIPYRINSNKFKDPGLGFSEMYLQYSKDKQMKTVCLEC